jgi:hypothetical protein
MLILQPSQLFRRIATGALCLAAVAGATVVAATPASAATLGESIVAIALRELNDDSRNYEWGGSDNCTYYSGQVTSWPACNSLGWRGGNTSNDHTYAWCASFAKYVWREAGVQTLAGLDTWASSFRAYGQSNGTWHARSSGYGAQPGDAVVFDDESDGVIDHVGIVRYTSGGTVYSIEGNVSNRVSAQSHSASSSSIVGYASAVGAGTATPSTGPVSEAASNNDWTNLQLISDTGARVVGDQVSAIAVNSDRIVYTLSGGAVYESASSNYWRNSRMIDDSGNSVTGRAVAAAFSAGVKYVYTIGTDGRVYEARSDNYWRNAWTGISGITGDRIAVAINGGGVKYIYTTTSSGQIYEAASNNAWTNLWTGTNAGAGKPISVNIDSSGVRFIYNITSDNRLNEAASDKSWTNAWTGVTTNSTVLSTVFIGDTKLLYTISGGGTHEASSANAWSNQQTSASASASTSSLSAIAINNNKYLYSN